MSTNVVNEAMNVGGEIQVLISSDVDNKGALQDAGNKMVFIHGVLDLIRQFIESAKTKILKQVLKEMKSLRVDIQRVKDKCRFVYLLQAKDCQDKIHKRVNKIQVHLKSLLLKMTKSVSLRTGRAIKAMLSQSIETGGAGLETQLEKEREQAAKLRSMVTVNELQLQNLHEMELDTPAERQLTLNQVEDEYRRRLQDTQEANRRIQVEYLKQVMRMLQPTESPAGPWDIPCCPISHEPLQDPVVLDCVCKGTLSRTSFIAWEKYQESYLTSNGNRLKCPICRSLLQTRNVAPNVPLREMLEAIRSHAADEPTSPVATTVKQAGSSLFGRLTSIALSSDGSCVAIGESCPDGRTGHVRIYDWTGNRWTQLGTHLVGEWANEGICRNVALSSDGKRVAIGSTFQPGFVRIYDWTGRQWTQVGSDLVSKQSEINFGSSITLSSDGNRIAIGAPRQSRASPATVLVYEWSGDRWVQLGSDLVGISPNQWFGCSIALSSDGNRIALSTLIGCSNIAGRVRVYDWSGSQWTQVGPDLVGEAAGDRFGWSVALSSDGNRIAVGAPFEPLDSFNTAVAGHVCVYDWTGRKWTHVGSDLVGEARGDRFGWSVAISSNGNRITVGAPFANKKAGVQIFEWSGRQWKKAGSNLFSQERRDFCGKEVTLSSEGNRVAIWESSDSGSYARIYDL